MMMLWPFLIMYWETLFKSVSVYLNGVKITSSNVYQAIENYFVTRFGVAKDATKIHVQALQGLTDEAADKHDILVGYKH